MTAPLTAELFARAIIASAISFGADSIEALTTRNRFKRACLAPAAIGLASAADVPLRQAAGVLGLRTDNILKAQARGSVQFCKAVEASREAATYHLRGLELKTRARPCAEPAIAAPCWLDNQLLEDQVRAAEPALTISIPVGTDVVVFEVEPAPAPVVIRKPAPSPAPSRPAVKTAAKPARAMPRGAKLVNLGDGVQRIVTQPVPESVARHAKQQLDHGADLDFVAELFGFEPADLKAAVDSLNRGEAA